MSQIKIAKNNTKMYNTYRVPGLLLFQFSLILHNRNQGVFLLQKVSHNAKPSRSRSKTLLKMLPKILLCSSVCLLVGIFVLVWVFSVYFSKIVYLKKHTKLHKKNMNQVLKIHIHKFIGTFLHRKTFQYYLQI